MWFNADEKLDWISVLTYRIPTTSSENVDTNMAIVAIRYHETWCGVQAYAWLHIYLQLTESHIIAVTSVITEQ